MAKQKAPQYTPTEPPERVASAPVPVPHHADDADRNDARRDAAEDVTDRVPGDALDDRGTFQDPVLAGERGDPDDLTAVTRAGTPEYHEPEPQRTAFGAATVGGAAAAAAQAGPSHEVHDRAEAKDATGDQVDLAAGTSGEADHNGRHVRDELTAERTAAFDADADRADAERTLGGPSDLPETTPAANLPAETTGIEEPIAGLWGEGTAQGYRDRWREVQFRFVDDPPAAAREANLLVEEAVGALTAELSRQKEALGAGSGDDTEELRAVVRRHRDFLDRLLGL
ncbi:hypothetical protein [Phytohabitans kaempferiae]|uniref:Uncharacterized protein n=1 Tax=Phytohabitans kaempferiae TaxID=1620943 RepID=A0ABV6MC41_9ACTN